MKNIVSLFIQTINGRDFCFPGKGRILLEEVEDAREHHRGLVRQRRKIAHDLRQRHGNFIPADDQQMLARMDRQISELGQSFNHRISLKSIKALLRYNP